MINKLKTTESRKEITVEAKARLAMRTTVGVSRPETALDAMLKAELRKTPGSVVSGEWALKEVECAREFNFELPEDLVLAVELIEQSIQSVMGVRKSVVLLFEEETGVYACLNDMKLPGAKVRELTRISDCFLRELIGEDSEVIHSYLLSQNSLTGIVVVSGKADGTAFSVQDQMMLDILSPYLANKIIRFKNLKQSLKVPYIQSMVLELAGFLVTAVDQDAIMTAMLEIFSNRLGFDACQYVSFNAETGTGELLYEITNQGADAGRVSSYSHAGLEGKRRTIRDYANLVGLLSSLARNRHYLHLNARMLGDSSLEEIFGLDGIQSALLLPVMDVATGEILGTYNLFHLNQALISEESREIAKEATWLASRAMSRALVLEKALAMASSDELTGLINRRGFYQRFEGEIERSRRHDSPLCVALIDVDHFKHFNDTYGHLSGDLILKALADLFSQNVRKSDVVCRFGGEEFAILLPDTSVKAGMELLNRVRQSVEKMQLTGINGETLRVTMSAGLAEVDVTPRGNAAGGRSEISEALALADEQLYSAKKNGRNQVCAVNEAD